MTQPNKLEGWTFKENGDLDCKPMTEYGVMPFGGGIGAVLRFQWALEPTLQQRSSQQMAITLPMLIELIGSLTRAAEGMMAQLNADRPNSNPN